MISSAANSAGGASSSILAEPPLWHFAGGTLDTSALERDIPPAPGVEKVPTRLDAREHITFGGCLEKGAKGWVAGMILRPGKGGDFQDFTAIEQWAGHVADELTGGG